jgi:hypothetical protein
VRFTVLFDSGIWHGSGIFKVVMIGAQVVYLVSYAFLSQGKEDGVGMASWGPLSIHVSFSLGLTSSSGSRQLVGITTSKSLSSLDTAYNPSNSHCASKAKHA